MFEAQNAQNATWGGGGGSVKKGWETGEKGTKTGKVSPSIPSPLSVKWYEICFIQGRVVFYPLKTVSCDIFVFRSSKICLQFSEVC